MSAASKSDAAAKSAPGKKPDGRQLRSERSRQAIIDAMLELVGEGILTPTAQQVAVGAGVGIRTVFRHFADMETLFATMDIQMRETYEDLFLGGEREGTLPERIRHVIERRAAAYEKLAPTILSTLAQIWRSPVLQKNYARNQRGLRKDLVDWLPEIAQLPAVRREAVEAAASFETWHRLRAHQGLGKKATMEVVREIMGLAFGVK